MESNTTHEAPNVIEDLGDGTFYYNFDVQTTELDDGTPSYNYKQVRCNYPIVNEEIQTKLTELKINHIVNYADKQL